MNRLWEFWVSIGGISWNCVPAHDLEDVLPTVRVQLKCSCTFKIGPEHNRGLYGIQAQPKFFLIQSDSLNLTLAIKVS